MSKEKKAKKAKGNRLKRFLTVLLCVFLVLALFVGVTTVINVVAKSAHLKQIAAIPEVEYETQLQPLRDENGEWYFETNRELKIVQLTDVHLGGGWLCINKDSSSIDAVAAILLEEKPDFVVVTGDIGYPVPFQAGTFNNKTPAVMFADLMEELGVYWTVCFGNHDTEAYSYYDREFISDLYMQGPYPHCLLLKGPDDIYGVGNQVIKIRNTNGVITRALILLDSNTYLDDDRLGVLWHYDNIHPDQIEWYKQRVEGMNAENAEICAELGIGGDTDVKTSVFFHIPLEEFKIAWKEFAANGYKDTEDVHYNRGLVGETGLQVYCGVNHDEMFETMLELGSTDTVFCGHDHYNYFSVNYKGIDLSYSYSLDYLAYFGIWKKGSQRGCTIIHYGPDGSVRHELSNLYSGKYSYYTRTEGITMQFEDVSYEVPNE